MKPTERDDLVRDIARRVLDEQRLGRSVDPDRLRWAREQTAEPRGQGSGKDQSQPHRRAA